MKRFVSVLSTIGLVGAAHGVTVVAPNSHALVEGDANNGVPFSYGGMSLHYQQVYDASQFSALGSNGGTITSVAFRCHERPNEVSITYQITVKLSTTARPVDGLTTNLTANAGPDNTIVCQSANYRLGRGYPVGVPWPFPIVIPFGSGFFYNPANGNLLVDIQIWQAYTWYAGPLVDTVVSAEDSVSRVYEDAQHWYGSTPDTIGAVTAFGVTPVVAMEPRITSTRMEGSQLICEGTGGAPGLVYCALEATNASQPLATWSCIRTAAFDATGNFSFTNTASSTAPQRFYRAQIQ